MSSNASFVPARSAWRRVAAGIAAALLFGVGVLHVIWMWTAWPAVSRTELAAAVAGATEFPSPLACLVVAALLLLATAFVLGLGGTRWIARVARVVVVVVMLGRGVGGVLFAVFLPTGVHPFDELSLVAYSPLCVLIGVLIVVGWWGTFRQPRQVRNVHERRIAANGEEVRRMLDTLGTEGDLMWRTDLVPAMVMSDGPRVGSSGGHGLVRYHVTAFQPGERIEYTLDEGLGLAGTHTFTVSSGEPTVIRHEIRGELSGVMRWAWGPIVEPTHDGVIEDVFDHVERVCTGEAHRRVRTPGWFRALARPAARAEAKRGGAVVRP